MLNDYITGCQLLLHDTAGSFYSTPNITRWVNEARRRVAGDAECIRILASGQDVNQPLSSGVFSVTVINGGQGYISGPSIQFTPPDVQGGVLPTASVFFNNGVITAINILTPGSGYINPPDVSALHGSGLIAQAILQLPLVTVLQTKQGVEKYSFSLANPIVALTPGVKNILWVRQVVVSWGSLRPALAYEPFTRMQAYYRAYSIGIRNFPSMWSQFGQGENGSVYFWPIPSQALSMDWDCVCQPLDLATDTDPEAIPRPFTDAVKYYASYLALMYAQRFDDAEMMKQRYKQELGTARANSMRAVAPNYYYGY